MSNPNDLATSFVAMAKAFEELPKVREELDRANTAIEDYAKQVQTLQMRIIDYKNSVDEKLALIRKVEAERDDAELRFLESEDRTSSALSFIKSTFGSAGSLIQALEPPAPVSIPMPPAEPEVIHIQPGLNPSWASRGQEDGARTQEDAGVKVGASEGSPASTPMDGHPIPGNGNGDPSTDAPSLTEAPAAPTVDPTDASTMASPSPFAPSTAESTATAVPSGPFANKRYYDHPSYLTLAAWLDGGGTEADYNWRPTPYKSGY